MVPSGNGVDIAIFDWGGDGPPLIFAHATGLHSHVWAPIARRLRSHFHCYAVDVRGQGESTRPTDGYFGWDELANDFALALDTLGLSGRGDVYGIGHSQGGFAVLSGEYLRPGTFRHIFGFEPVVFPDVAAETYDHTTDNVMVAAAKRRREVFASREEAYTNYRSKPPYSMIDDEAARAYVQWGFHDLDDGTVQLACRAADEAALFVGAGTTGFLAKLPDIKCRITLGLGEFTTENFKMSLPMQAERLPDSELVPFPGRTHFGPMERTDEMCEFILGRFIGGQWTGPKSPSA